MTYPPMTVQEYSPNGVAVITPSGVVCVMNEYAEVGHPILEKASEGYSWYAERVYLHPIDYYWLVCDGDIFEADRRVQNWLQEKIQEDARKACAKLDYMYAENRLPPYYGYLYKNKEIK